MTMINPKIRDIPPTVEEVKECQYWWNFPPSGGPPHILNLDVDDFLTEVEVIYNGGWVFSPEDYPGKWAPCIPPKE